MNRLDIYCHALQAIADGATDAPAVARRALDSAHDHAAEWGELVRAVAALPQREQRALIARLVSRGVRGPGER